MYLDENAQKELMSRIVKYVELDRLIKCSGEYDRNSPCLNVFFEVDENTFFVIYSPNATDDFGHEHFGHIALEIIVNDEVEFLDHDITDEYKLLNVLDDQLGVVDSPMEF